MGCGGCSRNSKAIENEPVSEMKRIEVSVGGLVAVLCVGGALFSLVMAGDIVLFLRNLADSRLANPPRKGPLLLLLPILAILTVSLSRAGWRALQRNSPQRLVMVQWALPSVFLWASVAWLAFLVHYPIPPQAHHTDKFLIACLILLVWGLLLVLLPHVLGKMLNSRPYRWLNIVFINVLVFAFVGECLVRLADPILARDGVFGDKHTPANLKAHSPIRGSIGFSNSQGFRDRDRVFEKRTSGRRILALGDSFTWGAGVSYDEAFITVLEERLRSFLQDTEIINLGVPAWGPYEEFHLLKIHGIRFSPDLVMLNFFIGNDIQNKRRDDVNMPQIMVVAGQSYYAHSNGNLVHDLLGPDRWHLYHNVNFLLKIAVSKIHGTFETATSRPSYDGPPLMSRKDYLNSIHERSDIYLKHDTEFFTTHWKRTQAVLFEMRAFLKTHQVPMLLIMIPEHLQLDRQLHAEYFHAFNLSPELYDFEKPQRLLLGWCKDTGVECIDLLPIFRSQGSPEKLYFANDFHFSAAGHVVAAEGILPSLKNQFHVED